jgi:hypothetical protein
MKRGGDKLKNTSKKDIVYGFVILILIATIITVIVWRTGNNAALVNQLSLTGSLTSIVLAFLAIIYAFLESRSSANENEKIKNTLNNINAKVIELDRISEELGYIRDHLYKAKTKEMDLEFHGEEKGSTGENEDSIKTLVLSFFKNNDKGYYDAVQLTNYLLGINKVFSPIEVRLVLGVLASEGFLKKVSVKGEKKFSYALKQD